MAPPRENSPYRLLVEGIDDKFSVINLLHRHHYNWDDEQQTRPFVKDEGGVDKGKLLDATRLGTALKTYQRLGLVLDADPPPDDRWVQARGVLQKLNVTLPEQPSPEGTIVASPFGPDRKVGLWLMPDNQRRGLLEDFLRTLVPPDDRLWSFADAMTTKARQEGAPLRERDQAKGALYAWLAWQEKPGLPFGTAITAKLLRHESAEALAFVAWFLRLFR